MALLASSSPTFAQTLCAILHYLREANKPQSKLFGCCVSGDEGVFPRMPLIIICVTMHPLYLFHQCLVGFVFPSSMESPPKSITSPHRHPAPQKLPVDLSQESAHFLSFCFCFFLASRSCLFLSLSSSWIFFVSFDLATMSFLNGVSPPPSSKYLDPPSTPRYLYVS